MSDEFDRFDDSAPDNGIRLQAYERKPCAYFEDERPSQAVRLLYTQKMEDGTEYLAPANRKIAFSFKMAEQGVLQDTFNDLVTFCPTCTACVPLRVNTDKFILSKSQKRLMQRTAIDFTLAENNNVDIEELFDIYKNYSKARHANTSSDMHKWNIDEFANWVSKTSLNLIAKKGRQTIGFSILSADLNNFALHYSVFKPGTESMSLGKQLWLTTILIAKKANRSHVYVGQWAKDSPKLSYKKSHSGLEAFVDGEWKDFNPKEHTRGPDYRTMIESQILKV